jgi:murein DD-endopeptidase MepM/ murein hydrolase activator NlpD
VGSFLTDINRAEEALVLNDGCVCAWPSRPSGRSGIAMTIVVNGNNAGGIGKFRNFLKPGNFFRGALIALLSLAAAEPALAEDAKGGPFEAVKPPTTAVPNFKQMFMSWKQLEKPQASVAIPSAQPVKGSAMTSGFGVRSDPFRGRAAMHAGIDLAGPIGTAIYATADAIVGRSEWANGYGNLIELNHGRGIQTRYGHLTRSLVRAGQRVKRGDLIGHMGSTGRSTGSHLHYEVRIDGKAVNPVPFMEASDYLLAVQQRAAAAVKVAMGGPSEPAK